MPLPFKLNNVDPSWHDCLQPALAQLDTHYATELSRSTGWLPGPEKIFNAFSLPLSQVKFVLLGESPYPRRESANGYAFWDAAVHELWSSTGLSKRVNRATSLRNILKMLLLAEGLLDKNHFSQSDIAKLPKTSLIQTNDELFQGFLKRGFLLLNASLVLKPALPARKDAAAWQPFMRTLLTCLLKKKPAITFILLGQIANLINQFVEGEHLNKICAEHPYNLSFITNPKMLHFFKPLHLLRP